IQLGLMSSLAGPEWGALELQPLELELLVPTGLHRRIAYERLFLDALKGNHALFVRADEVRAAWAWIDSVSNAWKDANLPMEPSAAGSWGPLHAPDFLPEHIVSAAGNAKCAAAPNGYWSPTSVAPMRVSHWPT